MLGIDSDDRYLAQALVRVAFRQRIPTISRDSSNSRRRDGSLSCNSARSCGITTFQPTPHQFRGTLLGQSLFGGAIPMAVDSLELQLASALQRYNTLRRRAESQKESPALLTRTLAELGTALEELRVAQDQLVESRSRLQELQSQLSEQRNKYWELFDEMPQPYVVTRTDSIIVEVNRAGAELFNVSQRFLVGKAMSIFVCEERSRFLNDLTRIGALPEASSLTFKLRPRERAPLTVAARVKGDGSSLRWVIRTS